MFLDSIFAVVYTALMFKKSLKNTILLNLAAFVLVFLLEILGGWMIIDKYDTIFEFYLWGLGYTISIMTVIWINHFFLIPYVLDKKRYVVYGLLLIATLLFGALIKIYPDIAWIGITKMFFFLIYTTGTGMAAFFLRRNLLIRRENEDKEKLQKEMELTYLKEQVNPHFLFNSLNSIYALSRQQSPETPDLVMQLSELMRYQLESAKKDTVLVREELEFIENYLLLEEKRLSKRCTIEFLITGEFLEYRMAPMLLIPFVENAIKHGAHSTNTQSSIDVSASLKGSVLQFSVVNSKPSIATEAKREGMGLNNVKRRLKLLYPKHQLTIEDAELVYRVHLSIDLSE